MIRTIMIFPQFENIEIIDNIREQYDPLSKLVKPHITIVFPFKSGMSNDELSSILDLRLQNMKPFEIVLQGFSKCEDEFGKYLFLNVIKGIDAITDIHNLLYENEFKEYDLGKVYIPHITLGKFTDVSELNKAYQDANKMQCKFCALVDKISVEMIGENEESIIIMEKGLRW